MLAQKVFVVKKKYFCIPFKYPACRYLCLKQFFVTVSLLQRHQFDSQAFILLGTIFVIPTVCFRPRLLNQLVPHSLIKFQVFRLDHCLSKNKHFHEQKQSINPAVQRKQVSLL